MTDHNDETRVDPERLNDAKYVLADHIASGEPLDDDARQELLACGLVTDADLKTLPNRERLWDPREWYEYTGSRWDVTFYGGDPVPVEQQTGEVTPPSDPRTVIIRHIEQTLRKADWPYERPTQHQSDGGPGLTGSCQPARLPTDDAGRRPRGGVDAVR